MARWSISVWWFVVLTFVIVIASPVAAQDSDKVFKKEQLDQMLAPVALYPDALLSQILMAATYPGSVSDAAAWSKAHPDAKGDAAVKQVGNQNWDPSVQSLVAFPEVLAQMGQHADWVQNVGDAFLAQPDDVMASIQRLRSQAQQAGNLKSNEQQKIVVVQSAPSTTVIQIEPANPQVVYVPSYNPTVVYGTWAYPSYPPPYWPPPPGYYHPVATGLAAGLAFGAGIAIANSLWGGFDWHHNDVNINVNRYNNINVNNRISGNGNVAWNHDPANRRGTPYHDTRSRQQYGQGVGAASARESYRGYDTARDASRERAMNSFDKRTNNGSSAAARRTQGHSAVLDSRAGSATHANSGVNRTPSIPQRAASPAPRSNAFSGVRSPSNTRAQTDRGRSSIQSMNAASHRSSTGSGRQISRPVPRRGGLHRG